MKIVGFGQNRSVGRPIAFKDENVTITSNVSSINLLGSSSTATSFLDDVDLTITPFNPATASIGDFGTRTHSLLTSLDADDHTQYHTDGRANTWFGTKSINDLGTKTHALLTSLTADDHTQYALLAGRASGQILKGGTAASETLTLSSTAHSTKGTILFGSSVYNETSNYLGIGGTPTSRFHVLGTTTSHAGRFDVGVDFLFVSPPTNPTLALINTPGNINVGTHYYRITYYTAVGETEFNASTTTSIATDAANGQVTVTIPVSSDYRVIGRKIYRAITGPTYWADVKLVGTVANNTEVTFVDNISDAARTGPDSNARGNTSNRMITVNSSPAIYAGPQNTFFGYRAGESTALGTTSGGENTIMGANSGITLNGSKNVAIGNFISVGSSDSSILIGHNAGGVGASFSSCLVFGRNAGFWCTGSYSSIILGGSAMTGSTYFASHYNVAIGAGCLSAIATGSGQLVVLGTEAADNITTSVGSIIIGAYVNAPSATTTGQLNIGNVLYGLGMYSTTSGSSTPTTAGQIGIGINPTGVAKLEVAAGSTTYVPFKLTSGALKTTAVAGGVEFLTDDFYATITTGTARKAFILDDGTRLTSGRVPFATTNGRLTDDADLTFAGDTLTATKFVGTTSVKVGTAAGYISSDGSTGATGTFTTSDLKTVTVKDGIITSIV